MDDSNTTFPNYETYSTDELIQALSSIDAEAFPERAAKITALIAERKAQANSDLSHQENDVVIRTEQVKFHGNTKEFFAIWIVNLLLSIVTLGIYSAWAKVRTNRYFYSNTELDGHRFAYLAEPLQILKGRIIAACLFGAYFLLSAVSPAAAFALIVVMMFLSPMLVILSMRFRMRMTAYRNVRFSFKGRYGEAFMLFVLLPIASVFTLYLLMPWVLKKIDAFLVDESGFGDKVFSSKLSTGEYYGVVFAAALISIVLFLCVGFVVGLLTGSSTITAEDGFSVFTVAMFGMYLFVYAIVSGFYNARIRNHIYQNSRLENVALFNSTVTATDLITLRLTNILATVFSLGFAIPWVKIRTAAFFADATQVRVLEGFSEVSAGEQGSASAVSEEAATLFDVDVALG
ncbi:membrane protein [Alteromonas sp. KC3]|uniref:YjgN family protein n=1 Tax=unclassified Alteromonas TaxID=2614992 RepID=UPI0019238A70|nr:MULTISPECIES: YjgN family protein [unclassified Alteromonas]BCO18193.1 membrane protein [Alteromonas sp. KC3]BCO22154.1 membrane protein [Alteromonas sp. KC14]